MGTAQYRPLQMMADVLLRLLEVHELQTHGRKRLGAWGVDPLREERASQVEWELAGAAEAPERAHPGFELRIPRLDDPFQHAWDGCSAESSKSLLRATSHGGTEALQLAGEAMGVLADRAAPRVQLRSYGPLHWYGTISHRQESRGARGRGHTQGVAHSRPHGPTAAPQPFGERRSVGRRRVTAHRAQRPRRRGANELVVVRQGPGEASSPLSACGLAQCSQRLRRGGPHLPTAIVRKHGGELHDPMGRAKSA
mmetsp:Transcript_108882/g.306848  ORF Transcript_108882/g.306848 Transcript_108882/m.306848 type:complete len:253 (+) Transcript_108882:893-1651(+)